MNSDVADESGGLSANGPDVRRMLLVLLLACAILPIGFIIKLVTSQEVLFPDFFGVWTFGRFVLTHPPAAIYDDRALHAYQVGFGMPATLGYPFPYPPWLLLVLAPIGALPYAVARVVWLVITFGMYVTALTAWRWERRLVGLLVLAPASAICLLVGQNGFLSAALMLGGMRLLNSRPIIAGALLACVAFKPNLAVLIPFVLLFGWHWRAIVGAVLATTALSAAVTVAFGADIWMAWLVYMRDKAASLSAGRGGLLDMMPSVTSGVLQLGGGVTLSHIAQGIAALAALFAIWRVRARRDSDATMVAPLATMLATPYLFHYDMPMATGAVLSVIAARIAASGRFGTGEWLLLMASIIAPTLQVAHFGPGAIITPAAIAAVTWGIVRGPHGPPAPNTR